MLKSKNIHNKYKNIRIINNSSDENNDLNENNSSDKDSSLDKDIGLDEDNSLDEDIKFFFNNIYSNKFIQKININTDFQDDCIGPCFPKNTYIYNPISLKFDKFNNKNMCAIKPINNGSEIINFKECNYDKNKNIIDYDIFDHNIFSLQIARNDNYFLKEIYNLNNINDIYYFIENDIDNLPVLTQKRILNCVFNIYINDNNFPNVIFINAIKKILFIFYNINIDNDKVYNNIIKNKKLLSNDIFMFIYNNIK